MDHKLRQDLANSGADEDGITREVLTRLMTADEVRQQIADAWVAAETDVNSHQDARMLEIAPGEEILDAVFMRYAGRHYAKRNDGPMIARMMKPPTEIRELLDRFLDCEPH
jgi:hypothetical protein